VTGIEKTFTVAVPVARAWTAFADGNERAKWEAETYEIEPIAGGLVHWTLAGHEATGRVEEAVPEKLLRHVEGDGPHMNCEITVTFEAVDEGTRITITHAGFGDAENWDEWIEATSLGWSQAIADLVLYLDTGVPARRFTRRMEPPGMRATDTPAGIVVQTVLPGGLADQAGLQPDDILLTVGGAPVFTLPELWVLLREHTVGDHLEFEYVRDGERRTGKGAMLAGAIWG